MAAFAIVDLETTGNSSTQKDRIIEIGIVVLKDGKVIEEFSSLVYPERNIPPFITSLTGISEEDVSHAPLFSEIVEEVYKLCQGAYIVAHNIEFDMRFLNAEFNLCGYPSLNNPILDTVELARILLPTSASFKLGRLAEKLSLGHDQPHRALSDAQVTSDLLIYLLDVLKKLPERTLTHLLKVSDHLKSELRPFIESAIEYERYQVQDSEDHHIWHGIAVKKIPEVSSSSAPPSEEFSEWTNQVFQGESGLKNHIKGYEYRKGQQEMAEKVYQSFVDNQHAMIEAGAGTGKSIGYLLPSLYYALKYNQKIVVSTHTTALQNQLLYEEIPKLAKLTNRPVNTVLYKGRSHYISLLHFRYELDHSQDDNYDTALAKAMILVWLTETTTGDIDEVQLPSNGEQFWHKISAEQAGKTTKAEAAGTYFMWAEKRAEEADIVISNHSILCLDLISSKPYLPYYDKVVIDEAHQLETVASRYFGIKLNVKELQKQLSQMNDSLTDKSVTAGVPQLKPKVEICRSAIDEAKEELAQLSKFLYSRLRRKRKKSDLSKNDIGRIQLSLNEVKDPSILITAHEMVQRFLGRMSETGRGIQSVIDQLVVTDQLMSDTVEDIIISRLKHSLGICQQMKEHLGCYFTDLNEEETKWIEIDGEGPNHSTFLFSEPVHLEELLHDELFSKKESVVLTSATLTANKSFSYIKKSIGLYDDENLIEASIPSPYRFDENVRLMIPNDFPNIKDDPDEYVLAVGEAIYSMAHVTKGRMLVLFTSYEMLRKTYELLKELILPEEYMIFGQGVSSGSRDRLKKNFQAFDQSILLGTSSFWEGVDIPGDDLSCLVIVRLPFHPPDQPVQKRREMELKEAGRNPFMEYSLPQAILRFRQGFGRLIRTSTDRGIVFVCDQRIMEARYGKYFINSIPKVPMSYESTSKLIKDMEEWL
ncbi:ATP-dependent DNA helicase DinG [Halobacillus sp. Marseille-Q1614]|uniref:ATP-dependent DNA helicase DinG n=1 Tax=Halobacillus sp. Marseille-Q1614 TaxID=2709134 RepID=UPI00156D4B5A|nr:ATP-dependent DNA helicase DinG [Halobacillus sp. Marseille-Q1614]